MNSTLPTGVRIEEVTFANVNAACRLEVHPDQRPFVAPVVHSLAEAYASRETAWPRLMYDGDTLVAFVMGNFSPDNPIDVFRCGIWRLNVGADHQGKGYGRIAVNAVIDEARSRGSQRTTVLWKPGEKGPEQFYLRLGFQPTGQEMDGEIVAELHLT